MNAWHVSKGIDGKGRPWHIVREVTVVGDCPALPDRCVVLDNAMHVARENVWDVYPYWFWTRMLAMAINSKTGVNRVAVEHLKRYEARFEPVRRDDLKPGMAEHIGETAIFQAGWEIEEGEPYEGEWAMLTPEGWPCTWTPLCDLQDVVAHDKQEDGE